MPSPGAVELMHENVGRRLRGVVEIARTMDPETDQVADRAWLLATASDVTDYVDMALEAYERVEAERDAARDVVAVAEAFHDRVCGCRASGDYCSLGVVLFGAANSQASNK